VSGLHPHVQGELAKIVFSFCPSACSQAMIHMCLTQTALHLPRKGAANAMGQLFVAVCKSDVGGQTKMKSAIKALVTRSAYATI